MLRGRHVLALAWAILVAGYATAYTQVLHLGGTGGSSPGGGAPTDAQYWVGAAHADLSAEKNLGALGTGFVINTGGVPSAYAGVTCTNQFLQVLSAVGAGTCATVSLTADVTGTLPIGNGGTGQTTATAAFDGLAPGSPAKGNIIAFDGTNWVKFASCTTGQFLRWNPSTGTGLECAAGPNVAVLLADSTNSSSTVTTTLGDLALVPDSDTWAQVECTLFYQTAATTTGIAITLFANDGGSTAPPQFFAAKYRVNGLAANGTDTEFVFTNNTQGSLNITTGVNAATTYYTLEIQALVLTHATDTDDFIVPIFRSEVNLSAVTIKEGSFCKGYTLHIDS